MSLAQIKRFKDNPMSDDYKDKIRQSLKGRNTGENNPKWKGGVYKLVDAIRKSNIYKDWKIKCLIRDKYTCQISGIINKDVEVHHLNSISLMVEKYKIKTMEEARSCKELWDIKNGISITKDLHILFHQQYGKSNNTKHQFNKFKKGRTIN